MTAYRLAPRRPQQAPIDLCSAFCSLYIAARGLSTTAVHNAVGGSNNATPNPMSSAPPNTTKRDRAPVQTVSNIRSDMGVQSRRRGQPPQKLSSEQKAQQAAARSKEVWMKEQDRLKKQGSVQGGLAKNSIFAEDPETATGMTEDALTPGTDEESIVPTDQSLSRRSPLHMAPRLDPNPGARARWMRKMVIQNVRRRGRLTREMRIARTERVHTSRSRFFNTSIKKLAPLARQIAGKSIDEAIMQMRFSAKKAAREVHKHLVVARNEAVVIKGMGLPDPGAPKLEVVKIEYSPSRSVKDVIHAAVEAQENSEQDIKSPTEAQIERLITSATQTTPADDRAGPEISESSSQRPLPTQKATKALKKGYAPASTDIYIAQAWVNRGKYGREPSPRARGRMDVLQIPHTGISVMLKEEKTREREKMEKDLKAIRKRIGGKVWTQLPDRPVTRQSQYVLW